MTAIPLNEFLRIYPGMTQVDAAQAIPTALLERAALCNRRLVLTLDGKAMGVVVSMGDFDLLEITSHGIELEPRG